LFILDQNNNSKETVKRYMTHGNEAESTPDLNATTETTTTTVANSSSSLVSSTSGSSFKLSYQEMLTSSIL